jgi:hypothetical protein
MAGWRQVHIGFENDGLKIDGVDVWRNKWRSTRKQVRLPHPAYPDQIHDYTIWEISRLLRKPLRFAAAELSGGVYGFYVPED